MYTVPDGSICLNCCSGVYILKVLVPFSFGLNGAILSLGTMACCHGPATSLQWKCIRMDLTD